MTQLAPSLLPNNSLLAGAARNGWWLFLIRGLLALAVGIIALIDPAATLAALILLLGSFFIVDGVFAVVKAIRIVRSDRSWWVLVLSGAVSIAAGMVVFTLPGLTAVTLAYLIGIWAVVTGVFELIVASSLRNVIRTEWLYLIFGIVSIAFGMFVFFVPGLGLAYLTFMIAIYGFLAGISLITTAIRLRRSA